MVKLAVFDMAGTTVRDNHEVEKCFAKACEQSGLEVSEERILAVQGWSKRFVFETLWKEKLGEEVNLDERVDSSYNLFKEILENHYLSHPVSPTEGCLEVFEYLRSKGVKIALTTGFYRKVTDIILEQLGWMKGLDKNRMGNGKAVVDLSIASDEVENGRPAPDMIEKAMKMLKVTNIQEVINIGDTPSDLESGLNAGVYKSFGVTNGTHTQHQLEAYQSDGLLSSLKELKSWIEEQELILK